jgi:hypothetical protein
MAKGDLLLRGMPIDVLKVVLKEQGKEKEKRGLKQFSISTTIIKIIREWNNKCREV